MNILAIETSCDETAVAVVRNGITILSNVVASSAVIHQKYGGVVPEVAARKQVEYMIPVLDEAMKGLTENDIDTIAVTVGPGLVGSLLVGIETAKTLAFAWNKPIIPVNHVLAHIYAVFLKNDMYKASSDKKFGFPAIALVVSGGHTELYLMKDYRTLKWLGGTLDDAAGECFDKCARLLGLPYPGGPAMATAATKFNIKSSQYKIELPRPIINDKTLNFSFSGLKTAVFREWNRYASKPDFTTYKAQLVAAFAYEIQDAITDVLVTKTLNAVIEHKIISIIVTGGVAANTRLKDKFQHLLSKSVKNNLNLCFPPSQLCVDNACCVAANAYFQQRFIKWQDLTAQPNLSVEV